MPKTMVCYTFAALALIGIPPASGFISKWYLAQGALGADVGVFRWLGPVVLLVSALLTAGYLLLLTMQGFFPGEKYYEKTSKKQEPPMGMLLVLIAFAVLSVLPGIFPNPLISYVSRIAEILM